MNGTNPTNLPDPNPRSTAEMLESLSALQGKRIRELHATIDRMEAANLELARKLLAEGEERKAHLALLQHELTTLVANTRTVMHQRDTVFTALENLVNAIRCEEGTEPDAAQFAASEKAIREALELIKVVHGLRAQYAKKK